MLSTNARCAVNHQTNPRVLINHGVHEDPSAVGISDKHKIVAPDMVWVLTAQAQASTIVAPQSFSSGLFVGYLQAFLLPDTLYTFLRRSLPASVVHHGGNRAVAISTVGTSRVNHLPSKRILIITS
jgi:hypothetical protein